MNGDKVDFADIVYIDEATDELMANSRVYTNDVLLNITGASIGRSAVYEGLESANVNQHVCIIRPTEGHQPDFIQLNLSSDNGQKQIDASQAGGGREGLNFQEIGKMQFSFPSLNEQKAIGRYFNCLDHLITLHHRKQIYVLNTRIYEKTTLIITKEKKKMPELEKVIEDKLIEQLVFGESQWTYREDLKTEEDLWKNFRYILEQNNKARLDGQPLSDAEFEQVKNQLQFSSFYKAGEWLVGENGKAMVHVQRDTEKLHLVVMNHEHIAGGSSVYEVINQYNALKDDDITTVARDRRIVWKKTSQIYNSKCNS